jgi:hypothetical protein
MKTTIDMAREAGAIHIHKQPKEFAIVGNDLIKAFEALVREDEREETNRRANASWTLMCEKMIASEREACAKVCENDAWRCKKIAVETQDKKANAAALEAYLCAEAIRARGKT